MDIADSAIPMDVCRTPHGYLATDRLVHRWGEGATMAEALAALQDSLADYLADLQAHIGRLSPRLAAHLLRGTL